MTRHRKHPRGWLGLALLGVLAAAVGCHAGKKQAGKPAGPGGIPLFATTATELELPATPTPSDDALLLLEAPRTLRSEGTPEYWDLALDEAMQIALTHSKVLRDLGGQVLRSPATVRTIHGPAIEESDPRFGVSAALSAYDAVLSATGDFQKNDRAINNQFFGGGTRLLTQDLINFQTQLTKRAATGSQFTIRNNTNYDANNAPGNQFPSAWNVNYEAEVRQPLLQGAGVAFNRTVGPLNIPGVYTGVSVARLNTDVSLADFEAGLRDLVSNVENTYWDLYFAYRDLDAKIAARDTALETWRRIQALYVAGRAGGEAEKEAQAREQYFRFQADVENALSGVLIEGTQTGSGSLGGTFRGSGGVYVCERRLRMMMGLPPSDGRLVRPSSEPPQARMAFDWDFLVQEALVRRPELRRQRWMVKRFELELLASRGYLLPRFDTVGLYRWRGFGDDLIHSDRAGRPQFDNAYQNLTGGDFQEWQLGMEFNMPLGFRRGHAAVRNAQLRLSRERALLREQELEIAHAVAAAVADVDRALTVTETQAKRRGAAKEQLAAVQAAYDAEAAPLDLVLEAQRRVAEADGQFFRSLAEYAVAVKNVHFEKGSLLDYNQVFLSESGWPDKAYRDAAARQARRRPWRLNYSFSRPPAVSNGPAPQGTLPPGGPDGVLVPPPLPAPPPTARRTARPGGIAPATPPTTPPTTPNAPSPSPAAEGAPAPSAPGTPAPARVVDSDESKPVDPPEQETAAAALSVVAPWSSDAAAASASTLVEPAEARPTAAGTELDEVTTASRVPVSTAPEAESATPTMIVRPAPASAPAAGPRPAPLRPVVSPVPASGDFSARLAPLPGVMALPTPPTGPSATSAGWPTAPVATGGQMVIFQAPPGSPVHRVEPATTAPASSPRVGSEALIPSYLPALPPRATAPTSPPAPPATRPIQPTAPLGNEPTSGSGDPSGPEVYRFPPAGSGPRAAAASPVSASVVPTSGRTRATTPPPSDVSFPTDRATDQGTTDEPAAEIYDLPPL